MALRFQADADFDQDIVRGIIRQQPEIDFQSATAAGLEGLSDLEVLVALKGVLRSSLEQVTMGLVTLC